MMDSEKLEDLKHFVELCRENPSILLNPSLTFFKNFLESLGAQVPSSVKSEQGGEEHDDELDEDIIESDVELDNTDIVEPDNDPPQQMGDSSSEVTDENRDTAQLSKAKALDAISEGKLNEAIDHLTEAILLNPNSAILYATRANVFIKLKKPNAAIRDADAALKVNPDSAKGYKVRGMARAMLGLWKEAASDLRVASMIDFDEEIAEILKKVEPNAHKIEEHCRKYQRLREEKKLRKIKRDTQQRHAELKAAYEKSKKKEQQSEHEASDPDSASDLNDGAKDTLTAEGTNVASDTSSALYLHPSDSPRMMLVPVHFDGTGYPSWRSEVMQALSVKNKLGFVDGSCGKPDANSPLFRQWKMCDDMVTSWILNSMTKEISDSVEYVNDSVGLWKVLEDRYDQINGAKMYQIQKEINNLTQGILDITVYYMRMNELWEELSNLNLRSRCNCTCICGGKDSMHKAEQDRRLIQFLMGLNEEYSLVRGNILMMNPLPSVAQAFSLLIQEDKQKDPDSASASDLNDGKVVDIHSLSELETKLNAASKASRLAILYFTATWCGPCRFVSPFYSSLPGKYPEVAFLKADIDEARDVASRWNVSGIPSFFFMKNGKEVDMVVGADKNSLEKKIAQYAGQID